MKQQLNLSARIRRLKPGEKFTVKTEAERQAAIRDGKTLRRAGVIDFLVTTRAVEGGEFLIIAV